MGQVTDQSSPPDPTVYAVQNLSSATLVGTSLYRTCAMLTDKRVSCWGWSYGGVLGDNSTGMRPYPGPVPGLSNVIDMSLGGLHTCVVFTTSTGASSLACWGDNESGQSGADPATLPTVPTPQEISGLTNVVQISAGGSHSCVALKTGQVLCWGANDSGQLGGGAGSAEFRPKLVDWATGVASVFAGGRFTCARLKSGGVQCWGLPFPTSSILQAPTAVPGLNNAASLAEIGTKLCGLLPGGTISCVDSETSTPTQLGGLSDVEMLSGGGSHWCVLVKGGVIRCWGSNMYGQLGDETTNDSETPVTVKGP